jgi:tetratricopeptide (TPR) repeat protein
MRLVRLLFSIAFVAVGAASSEAAPNSDWATCAKAVGDDAIAACGRQIKARKGSELAVVYVNRCLAMNAKRDYDLAIADCSEAIRIDPKNARSFGARCLARTFKKDFDNALTDCDESIRLDPENATGYYNRCTFWNSKPDLDRAIADCGEAIRLNPKYTNAFIMRCNIWNAKKEYDRAIADCTQAISLSPKIVAAYVSRGLAWRLKGEYDRAIDDYTEAIRIDPKYVVAYNNRCAAWNYKRDPDRAIADCSEAIRLNPKYVLAHDNRANSWREKGALDRAIEDYGEVIRLDFKYAGAYTNRGLLYEKLGRYESALLDFRAAAALTPQSTIAKERVERIERRVAAANEPNPPVVTPPAPSPRTPAATPPVVVAPRPPAAAPTPAEVRVALVIGNGRYANAGSLPNARNDAETIAATLKRIGFTTVSLNLDLPREKISDALKSFAAEADRADWAVVYYAGHGIEFGGTNYLIPTDAKLASDRDISFEAVALDQVLLAVEGARKLRLVVLDACRDNPFAGTMRRTTANRSIGRGLARVEPEGATLVVYAARDGQVAQDGNSGGNSPFATAFVKYIETPGLEISLLFRKVRDDVLTSTGRKQEPFVYGSLPASEFYFRRP